jgi:PadR family transcriptional regulator, regulatory protein PadR
VARDDADRSEKPEKAEKPDRPGKLEKPEKPGKPETVEKAEQVEKLDVPQGTLDLMILTILAREAMHGYGISQRLTVLSHEQFRVNPGSLFPSLYRLEQDGKLKAEWRASENNRNAKYYALTAAGRKQLEQHRRRWDRISFAITSVLEGA